jgi:hypothetical protein
MIHVKFEDAFTPEQGNQLIHFDELSIIAAAISQEISLTLAPWLKSFTVEQLKECANRLFRHFPLSGQGAGNREKGSLHAIGMIARVSGRR